MLEKISKALHINSMYLNMDDHTGALDFVFTLLDWHRTTDFIIKKVVRLATMNILSEQLIIQLKNNFSSHSMFYSYIIINQ